MTANSTDFAVLLTKYFSDYLPLQRGYSENTIASYSTSFKLLLNYANQREKIRAQNFRTADFSRKLINEFERMKIAKATSEAIQKSFFALFV